MTANPHRVYQIRPLKDPRWSEFLERHPRSSVFHTLPWLEALCRTFAYEPIAFTTSPADADLQNAVVLCRVNSWLTGRRLVSLPFSDHCDPLVADGPVLDSIVSALKNELSRDKFRYVEIRPAHSIDRVAVQFHSTYTYCSHQIDLRRNLDALFRNCHKSSTQRKIRRAGRDGLIYEDGRSDFLLDSFYDLLLLTRRRHRVPPQPKRWFQSLIDCFGETLKIRVAFKDKRPVASILTLRHKDTLVYKYGGSDAQLHRLGGMQFLFWTSIEEAKRDGLCVFDLGRSAWRQGGLITFKDRLGATRSELKYWRLSRRPTSQERVRHAGSADWKERIAQSVFPHLPDRILCSAGDLICRHLG